MNNDTNVFNPVDLDLSRSTFHFTPTITGTTMAGRLIPAFTWEVLPGDSVKMDLRTLFKMATPVYPTMDVLYADVAFYFVPNRLILSRRYGTPDLNDSNQSWEAFIGAQDNLLNMPIPADGITLPAVYFGDQIINGTLPDYFCIGGNDFTGVYPCNSIPFLAYFAIWSENYRDPNMFDPVTWSFQTIGSNVYVEPYCNVDLWVNSAEATLFDRSNELSASYAKANPFYYFDGEGDRVDIDASHWLPLPTCVFHGYFGSLLPWPQRNLTGVPIFPEGALAPVDGVGSTLHKGADDIIFSNSSSPMYNSHIFMSKPSTGIFGIASNGTSGDVVYDGSVAYSNLYANLNEAVNANVNALRAQVQLQRWYEKIARSGNRYDEFEYGLFGVRPHDSGYDRPVYLGGKRIPLNIEMVASTNGGTSSGAAQGAGSLGELGAFSHTNDSDHYFYHSFDDFGTLMCVFTIRHHNTISRGVHKQWMRRTREDYYFPVFAHLGEQETVDFELDAGGTGRVLGFNPAWEEYRTEVDRCCGLLKDEESLDFMTYTSYYYGQTLKDFVNASQQIESIDKTLAVTSIASGFQFIYQFNFDFTARRCMPTYSIPGLVDHF